MWQCETLDRKDEVTNFLNEKELKPNDVKIVLSQYYVGGTLYGYYEIYYYEEAFVDIEKRHIA